jgi:hypothetical protein
MWEGNLTKKKGKIFLKNNEQNDRARRKEKQANKKTERTRLTL